MKMHLVSTLALCAALTLSGCGHTASQPEPKSVSLIIQNASNAPAFNASTLDLPIELAQGDAVSLVCPDSDPSITQTYTLQSSANNSVYAKKEAEQWHADLLQAAEGIRPTAPDTDVLRALTLASRQLQASSNSEKQLYVINSGLNTCAPVDMSQGAFWTVDIEALTNQLDENGYCPSLDGVSVQWFGLGDTDPSVQASISPNQRLKLQRFWECYFQKCGASVVFHSDVMTGSAAENTPPIRQIPVLDDALDASTPAAETEPVVETLDQQSLTFLPDSAAFASPSDAEELLGEIAARILQDNCQYTIIGTTAQLDQTDNATKAIALSESRAAAVRKALLAAGVPDSQLTETLGLGSAPFSLRSQNEAENRAVFIIRADVNNEPLLQEAKKLAAQP